MQQLFGGSKLIEPLMEENISLCTQLEASKITIDGLKRSNDSYSNKILRLQSKASLAEALVGVIETQLRHAKSKTYGTRFEDYRFLVVQILSEVGARLLQVPFTT